MGRRPRTRPDEELALRLLPPNERDIVERWAARIGVEPWWCVPPLVELVLLQAAHLAGAAERVRAERRGEQVTDTELIRRAVAALDGRDRTATGIAESYLRKLRRWRATAAEIATDLEDMDDAA